MAKKPENVFIDSVHRHLPPVSELHREGMHNEYRGGTADMWYSGRARDLWVEYKFLVLPKRDTTVIDFTGGKDPIISNLQQEWLEARHAEGRNVWVIVGCKEGGVIFREPGWRGWGGEFTTAAFKASLEDRKIIADRIAAYTLRP